MLPVPKVEPLQMVRKWFHNHGVMVSEDSTNFHEAHKELM